MKYLFTLLATVICLGYTAAQDQKETLETSFYEYFKLVSDKDIDGTLDYMLPKMFELAPRELVKSSMEQIYEDEEMDIQFANNKLNNMSFLDYKEEDKTYAIVDYSFEMIMIIHALKNPEEEAKEEESSLNEFSLIHAMYNEQFGTDNVTADKENGKFTIFKNSRLIAVDMPNKGWKFLEIKTEMLPVLERLLPQAVVEFITGE